MSAPDELEVLGHALAAAIAGDEDEARRLVGEVDPEAAPELLALLVVAVGSVVERMAPGRGAELAAWWREEVAGRGQHS